MPRIANMATSRQPICCQKNCEPSRRKAKTPRIRTPASENRAASRISGGQSVTPILPATKAKLQSRQNSAIANGRVLKRVAEAEAGPAIAGAADVDMGSLLCRHDLGSPLLFGN